MKFKTGQKVKWNWGSGEAQGKIKESFTSRVEKSIKGSNVVRDADEENPAYLIKQDDGDLVLKSESELQKE